MSVTYYLATHQKVLAKLKKEIRSTFKHKYQITAASVNSLEYMIAVLNEALRIYPPVPGNTTRLTPPEGCMIAGYWVPGNICVMVNHWAASHYSGNFTRPYEFIPERWLGTSSLENNKKKVVQPFSIGPRSCLGRGLAHLELRVVLARLVWTFDIELSEESKDWDEGQTGYLLWAHRKPLSKQPFPLFLILAPH